jgi:glycosidase
MDFPLAGILRDIFTSPDGSVSALDSFLHAYFRYMADGPARVTFLDNHDMNRFLFLAHGDVARLKLAALCLFTLPGVPVIYYGTEIALPQRHDMANRLFDGDAEVRTDMVWDRRLWNLDLLAYFQQLIALRKRFASLRRGSWDSLHVDEQAAVYAYWRRLEHYEGGELVCAFNLGYASQTFPLRMPGRYTVIHTTQEIDSGSPGIAGAMVTLPAVSGAVLARLPEAV